MNVGLVLLVSASVLAVWGLVGYRGARRSASRSRYAALTLFGHGALASSAILAFFLFFRVDSLWPLRYHVQSAALTWWQITNCDLDAGCVAATVLALFATVLGAAFVVGQVSARLLLRRCREVEDAAASATLARGHALRPGTTLLAVEDGDVDAFSFAVLRRGGPHGLRGEDVIIVTSGLLGILSPDEVDAVVAHEAAHVEARDDRYAPFFHILATLLFFDPVLHVLRRYVGRDHEFAADVASVRRTRRPLSLARALLKVYLAAKPNARPTGFLGRGSRSEIAARIEALIALEDEGAPA